MERWETQRTLKNIMGKLSNCMILNREQDIMELFWSHADDVCLGFNDGWYRGQQAVRGYYDACYQRNKLVAKLLQQRFPDKLKGKTEEELYGMGPMKVRPMATPVIEVAEDGQTAKGLWSCLGAHSEVEPCGPLARWSMGYFAVDFLREAEGWKIWHMQYVNDLDAVCGQSWGRPETLPPELPEFAALKDFSYPPYSQQQTLRTLYHTRRPLELTPRIPEPYATFSETFSYAQKEA
jgi:hypothetical protein